MTQMDRWHPSRRAEVGSGAMVWIDPEGDAWSGEVRAAGTIRSSEGCSRKTVGAEAPGNGDLGRQVEGIGRLSIIPGPSSRAGRCSTFEGEERKFLSVIPLDDEICADIRVLSLLRRSRAQCLLYVIIQEIEVLPK